MVAEWIGDRCVSSLADAERLLAQHELLQEEIEAAKPRYENLKVEMQNW